MPVAYGSAMRYYATTWTLSSVRLTATPHDANPVATARIKILSGGQPQISYTNHIILLLLPGTFATQGRSDLSVRA